MSHIPNQQDPEQSLGFVLSDVTRLMRRNFNRRAQGLGLTQTQWRALAQISRHEGIKQSQLAEILEVRPISVARLIDRMQAAGWIRRSPDPNDRRAFNLYLTDKVEPLLNKMHNYATDIADYMLAGLSKKDQAAMLKHLLIVRKNLSEELN